MKHFILPIIAAFCLSLNSGCGNLSPRHDQKIDNQNGHIDEIKSNQNGIMAEIGSLKNQAEIQNSRLDRIQQGMVNLQSNYENSGVQIFSGPGGLIVAIVGFVCLTLILLHYRNQAKVQEKTANILAEKIVQLDDPDVEEAVFQAVMYTNVEENALKIFKKQKTLKVCDQKITN